MKDGFKVLLALLLAFISIMPFAILVHYLGGGLVTAYLFSPLYYALAWKMGMLKKRDSTVILLGIMPMLNLMGAFALLIILYATKFGVDANDLG